MRVILLLVGGAFALGMLANVCIFMHRGPIQADLSQRANKALEAANIDNLVVKADGRDLVLTGIVDSPETRAKAMALVQNTYGVRVGIDALQIQKGPTLEECELVATRSGDGIALAGIAPADATLNSLTTSTTRAVDAGGVTVAKLEPHAGMAAGMGAALPWLHVLTDAKVTTTPVATHLEGGTPRPEDAETALLAIVDGTPDTYGATVDMTLTKPKRPEDLWVHLRPHGKGAILGGMVASAAQRTAIFDAAKNHYGTVYDALVVADVEGMDFAPLVGAAAPVIAGLDNGRLHLSPDRFFLSGLTDEGASFDAESLGPLRALLPEGAALETDVATRLSVDDCQGDLNKRLEEEKIQFQTGKSAIAPASFGLLDAIASTLRRCPATSLTIEGHTDNEGKEAVNARLSERRANAVYQRLVETGMAPSRATAKGFGESTPIAENETPEGRALNRRIEFRLQSKDTP